MVGLACLPKAWNSYALILKNPFQNGAVCLPEVVKSLSIKEN